MSIIGCLVLADFLALATLLGWGVGVDLIRLAQWENGPIESAVALGFGVIFAAVGSLTCYGAITTLLSII